VNIRKTGGNVTAKVLSVLLATVLWFHVTTNSTFSSKCTLPIRYVGPSEGYVVASDKPEEATVVVKGTGKDLLVFYLLGFLRPETRYSLVNLTGLPEGTNTVTLEKSMIHLGMFSDLTIENILYPDNASFKVRIDHEIRRTVAVETGGIPGVRVRDGYCVVGGAVAKPEFVVIEGPSEIIERYNTVKIVSLEEKEVSPADTVLKASLEEIRFAAVEPKEVELFFRVEPLVTKRLSGLQLTLRGFPRRKRPAFIPDSLTVSVQGPESLLSNLAAENIVLAIQYDRYRDAAAKGDSLITPTVILPDGYEGIDIVEVIPRKVRFSTSTPKG